MSDALRIRPCSRDVAKAAVRAWHSHHKPHVGDVFRLGAYVASELVAVVTMGRPTAPALDDGETWEVTRLACGDRAPRYTASRLLGAAGRVMTAAGITLQVSYTRVDEVGSCYLAAGWTPVAISSGRPHTTGNRADRWLPGLYEPSSEVIDRVRWERGERARARGVEWDGARWRPSAEAAA